MALSNIVISPPSAARRRWAYKMLVFPFFSLVNDSVRPLISTSTGPIFTQFAGTPELCIVEDERPEAIFLDSLRNHAVANNFAGNIDLQSTHST